MKPKLIGLKKRIIATYEQALEKVKNILLSPYRMIKIICFWVGFVTIFMTGAIFTYFHGIYRSLPNLGSMDFTHLKQSAHTIVQNKMEESLHRGNYHWTDIKDINRDFLYAIVMSEDSTFFEHDGFDYDAIMTSLVEDINHKKFEYGASTISQQVAKNLFLSNEKAIIRKLKEVLITERLEKNFKKNQILEIYLNIAEFGPDMYGVEEAANRFFGKPPSEINAAEGAFIALMLPSPRKNYYAIYQNQNIAPQKRRKIRRILGDMLVSEFISPKQYKNYIKYDYFSHPHHRGLASKKGRSTH